MVLFARTLTEKDFATNLIGKSKRYRLARDEVSTSFRGRLLAFYSEGGETPEHVIATHVDTIALFKTEKNTYVVYYHIKYVDNDRGERRGTFIHSENSLDAVETFLNKMHYRNVKSFAPIILSEARKYDR